MGEREKNKEIIDKGELFFLCYPGTEKTFSGYGLTVHQGRKEHLVGLLMVDRPNPADSEWLKQVENTFGECQLVAMTNKGERGIVCQMLIEPESIAQIRKLPSEKGTSIKKVLEPLLDELPKPIFSIQWDEEAQLWKSRIAYPNKLPKEIIEVFERFGYGCLAAETNIGVIHVCHAADDDIDGFTNKPVLSQWQLIEMPTAPLIRLEFVILDRPYSPYKFESFLNVAEEDQARILEQLANQNQLYLAFYGDKLDYHFTKVIPHDKQQWQQLDELVDTAMDYWNEIPPEKQDFDLAKLDFMKRFI